MQQKVKVSGHKLKRISDSEMELRIFCKEKMVDSRTGKEIEKEKLFQTQTLKFEEITPEEIIEKRIKKVVGIVMSAYGKFYFAKAPKFVKISKLSGLMSNHKCANCLRLSAKSDERGGCQKVRDWPIKYIPKGVIDGEESRQVKITMRDILDSMRIEKYQFVVLGLETINTIDPELFVTECSNFEGYELTYKKTK